MKYPHKYGRNHEYIVFTRDLDFSAMLAATEVSSPSVIQIRIQDVSPQSLAPRFFRVIDQLKTQLTQSALVVVDARKNRACILPLKR